MKSSGAGRRETFGMCLGVNIYHSVMLKSFLKGLLTVASANAVL